MTKVKQLTPKEQVDAFSRKATVAMDILSDALRAFQAGEITQKELKAREKQADKITKELKQQIRDEK